jgi:hypothetical protein
VLSAPTTAGRVWLKATGAGSAPEAALTALLAELAPDAIVVPLATDAERGMLLLPDAGPPLSERFDDRNDRADAMIAALPRYARLQRATADRVEELLALGLPDMRPPRMPERFREALEAAGAYVDSRGGAGDRAMLTRLAALGDRVGEWSDRLADAPGGVALDHGDLHQRNVVTGPDGEPRFFDWGDAMVAHPFSSIHVTELVLPVKRVEEAGAAYLREFADLAPGAELAETLELACRLAHISRALTWQRAIAAETSQVEEDWARGPLESLAGLLG